MKSVTQQHTSLDAGAVLAILDEIDGDGCAALDPDEVIRLGLPRPFLDPLTESVSADDLSEVYVDVAGPATRLRAVWSLALLRAIVRHYGVDATEPYMGHSRNARVLSDRIQQHLNRKEAAEKGHRTEAAPADNRPGAGASDASGAVPARHRTADASGPYRLADASPGRRRRRPRRAGVPRPI